MPPEGIDCNSREADKTAHKRVTHKIAGMIRMNVMQPERAIVVEAEKERYVYGYDAGQSVEI